MLAYYQCLVESVIEAIIASNQTLSKLKGEKYIRDPIHEFTPHSYKFDL